MPHLYGVLGIPKDADETRIKAAYRSLVKACHPDLGGGNDARFREIHRAYQTLGNPARRAAYDAMARRRLRSALATSAASFTLTVGSGMFVAGLLLGV